MLTSVSQFSIDFVCTAFAGHLGALRLAAVTEAENVIICFAYGVNGMFSVVQLFVCDYHSSSSVHFTCFGVGCYFILFSNGQNPMLQEQHPSIISDC